MKDKKEFYNLLTALDGQPYAAYEQLEGDFDFNRYVVKCHGIDLDVDAELPIFTIRVPQTIAEIPDYLFDSPLRRTAMEDLLLRRMASNVEAIANFDHNGIARRAIVVASPGQSILPRNALQLTKEFIEVCVQIILPVRMEVVDGVSEVVVDGEMARELFFDDLPEVVSNSLFFCNMEVEGAEQLVNGMEDADRLRHHLMSSGYIGFVAEGAMVGRMKGTDFPDYERLEPVSVDAAVSVDVEVPHQGAVRGLGISSGLTVILGEADSGRVEIMDALAHGIYNHVPGDGRELVATVADAVVVAAEPGRSIQKVDISAFASELPDGGNPESYSTESACSFTSQAAALVESLEVGARVLLIDESTSSPSFLSSDSRIRSLFEGSSRNTLASRARQMVDELGVSLVVAGSSCVAEFIPIADTVLRVDGFKVTDITEETKGLDIQTVKPSEEAGSVSLSTMLSRCRWVMPSSIDPSEGRRDLVIEAEDAGFLRFGRSGVIADDMTQITDVDQLRAIGFVLYYSKLRYMDEGYPLREILDLVDRDLSNEGLNTLARDARGDLARPRRYEVAAVLNRLPSFRVSHVTE